MSWGLQTWCVVDRPGQIVAWADSEWPLVAQILMTAWVLTSGLSGLGSFVV